MAKRKKISDRVYVIGEKNSLPGYPPITDWHKIGRADPDSGQNKGDDDWYERIRALSQGNPRGLEVKYQINIDGSAANLEKEIHKECRRLGIINLKDITGEVGHGEWWNVTAEEGIDILERVYDNVYGRHGDWFTDKDGNPASPRKR